MDVLLLRMVLTVTLFINGIRCQSCSGHFGENDPGSKDDTVDSNVGFGYMMADNNYIIDCCGIVTSWEAYFTNVVGSRTVYFQIWRLSSGSTYTLVGENDFTVTSNGEQSKTITQSERITIKSGDRWGWTKSTVSFQNAVTAAYTSCSYGILEGHRRYVIPRWTGGADVITYRGGVWWEEDNNFLMALSDLNVGDTQDWSSATEEDDRSYAVRMNVAASNNPTFTNLPDTVSVANDVASGTSIFTVTTDDIDTYDVSTLTLSMSTSSKFSLDSATGIITTSTALGSASVQTLVLTVTDQCSKSATATLTVSITNDPPTIQNLPNATSISEDLTAETLIYTLSVTDTSTSSTITCSLASGGNGKFDVRLVSTDYGVYSIGNPSFDFSNTPSYPLSIACSDGDLSDTQTLTVNLIPNAAPVVVNLQNSTSVSTTTSIGTTIFTVITTDAEGDNLYYTMSCNPTPCPFDIFNSGEIRLNQDISNTTIVGYDVSISVSDNRNNVGPNILTITVTEINDPVQITNLPIGSPLTITENTALGTTVYTVSYSDVDTSQTHTFTMTSSPAVGSTYFNINSNTGVISTSGSVLNYETLSTTSFTFSVTVSDPITSDTQSISIDVINVNEAPSFGQSSYSLSTTEGAAGTVIGTPNTGLSDPDTGDTTSLSMDCGSNSGYFYLDSSTGTISFQSNYDLDTGSLPTSVSCTLTVTDSSGLAETASLVIAIADINDNVPIFSPTSYSFFISYYATSGTTVGNVMASDADSGSFGTLTFTLNQTTLTSEYFAIDNSGVITIKQAPSGSSLGVGTSVTISAIATDSGGLSDTSTVVIVLSDTTTTASTTTTDRQKTFFHDTRNIPWFLACIVIAAVIAVTSCWVIYTCRGENSCENWTRRFRQHRKLKKQQQKKKKGYRKRRQSSPDEVSTMNQLSVRTLNHLSSSGSVGLYSARKPPPPIAQQAWRSTAFS